MARSSLTPRPHHVPAAFILNYDEGGQFFDHVTPPVPPTSASDGASTVTAVGELSTTWVEVVPPGAPIGLGFRVPLLLISPWTRGHLVYSEVADHTSVIKLIEARFGVACPNISPWRRAVTGDLTAAFDFGAPDYSWPGAWPDTSQNVNQSKWQCEHLPAPALPTVQAMPVQEPGTRAARPLPYEFHVSDAPAAGGTGLTLTMRNAGARTGAFFIVFDRAGRGTPRKYTVEAGKALVDDWPTPGGAGGNYSLWLHGPNGFVRGMQGDAGGGAAGVTIGYGKVCDARDVRRARHVCVYNAVAARRSTAR
jgi:phospholipase C